MMILPVRFFIAAIEPSWFRFKSRENQSLLYGKREKDTRNIPESYREVTLQIRKAPWGAFLFLIDID